MFNDRKDAGDQLGEALEVYRDQDPIVLTIPKGGLEIGYEVAAHLGAEFAPLISRKLPFPDNPESGFGAIAEDGSVYISERLSQWVPELIVDRIVEEQKQEIQRRIELLRDGKPLPDIAGRTAILVDDGIAAGSTMRASIAFCRNQKAGTIAVGAPVTSARVQREIADLVDDIVILETPPDFRAVAQVYMNWYDVSDKEALDILARWDRRKSAAG